MKRIIVSLVMIVFMAMPAVLLAGCGVVPTAWVYFKMPTGYTVYTSDQYANTGAHIYYYENEIDATSTSNAVIEITFSPRIMGTDDVVVDGETLRGTTVDVSSYADITIYVKKSSSIYSPSKKIYINGVEATLTNSSTDGSLAYFLIQNAPLLRGNPNGQLNGTVNIIEYK